MRSLVAILILANSSLMLGCGLRGPLYLPEENRAQKQKPPCLRLPAISARSSVRNRAPVAETRPPCERCRSAAPGSGQLADDSGLAQARPRRRLVVPVPRVPRAAAADQLARRAHRRRARRAQHAAEVSCKDENAGSPMVVVFDAPGKTFRDDLFAEYKAQSPAACPMTCARRSQPLLDA